jgi:hypothetical protein
MLIGVFIIHYENIYNLYLNISLFHSIKFFFTSGVLYNIQRVPPHPTQELPVVEIVVNL